MNAFIEENNNVPLVTVLSLVIIYKFIVLLIIINKIINERLHVMQIKITKELFIHRKILASLYRCDFTCHVIMFSYFLLQSVFVMLGCLKKNV